MNIPQEVQSILQVLNKAGFEAFTVGGCVRDFVMRRIPKDWDVATSAAPDTVQALFPKHYYTNAFGTVTVLVKGDLKEVEVTTYRVDAEYSDKRHPDAVKFTNSLEKDLARRDFTMNAMAMKPTSTHDTLSHTEIVLDGVCITDSFGGLKDIEHHLVRAVGDPAKRFGEDALRLMRAVRFAAELNFDIEETTHTAIQKHAGDIVSVSQERVRDEFVKIVMSDNPEKGMNLLESTGLLTHVFPEMKEGVGMKQNKHHIYTVFEHSVKSLQYAARFHYPLEIRLAALFHDVAKPRTRRLKGKEYTFYGHDVVGARMTNTLMKRLRFSNDCIRRVTHLVRHHMFYYDVGKITESGVRRLLRRVGPENFDDLIKVRIAERKGSGVPKAEPYRLRHLQFMVEKVSQQPITVSQLAIGGKEIITELHVKPGPIIGGILHALLAEVLDDPKKNTVEYLLVRAKELSKEDPDMLKKFGADAMGEEEQKREDDIRRKYHV